MTQEPTVCVRIWGGLGNQMFCAAAGLALSHRLHGKLEFDLQEYSKSDFRAYDLDKFPLPALVRAPASSTGKASIFRRDRKKLARWGVPPDWTGSVWREPSFHYESSFRSLNGSVYLLGYFQSYMYFEDIAARVREIFDLRPQLSAVGKEFAQSAQGDDSIAVHVRRGDYASDPQVTAYHGIIQGDYYRRAISLIARHIERPRLFVLSDDEAAAREVLADWPDAQFVSGTTHFDDMHIITSCRHRVIANSSFSWWGAWLDPRKDGFTIAPRAWFSRDKMLTTYTGDLIPTGWILT